MLVNFKVENFRSIKEVMELSFESTNLSSLLGNITNVSVANNKSRNLLKTISIYGPNASGKSNLIKAMSLMKLMVVNSNNINKGDSLVFDPFKLDLSFAEKPTSFEISLILNGVLYEYGFKYNSSIILKEYLYYYPNGRKSLIFERDNNNSCVEELGCYKFTIDKTKQEFISSMTSRNKLYLSVATNLEYDKTQNVFDWINDKLVIHTTSDDSWGRYTTDQLNNSTSKDRILTFLKAADFNINNIETTQSKIQISDNSLEEMKEILKDEAINKLLDMKELTEIRTFKTGIDKEGNYIDVEFDINSESDGTLKFYELAGPVIDMLTRGCCLIYDELDTKLHPNLMLFLVKLFNKNKSNAQMVFSTHNVITLDQKYLRRDQVYLVDLLRDGSSELYSLIDFKEEKKSSNISKRYLTGRYQAVPYIDEDMVIESIMENLNGA